MTGGNSEVSNHVLLGAGDPFSVSVMAFGVLDPGSECSVVVDL